VPDRVRLLAGSLGETRVALSGNSPQAYFRFLLLPWAIPAPDSAASRGCSRRLIKNTWSCERVHTGR
jgi:hypothetical protein